MISKEYLSSISSNVKQAYDASDALLDAGGASLLGASGLTGSAALAQLIQQLRFIAKYNPEIISGEGSKSLTEALKRMRSGDVVVYGDPNKHRKGLAGKLYQMGSGGMGGVDEHAAFLQKLNPDYVGGEPGLRAVTTTQQAVPDLPENPAHGKPARRGARISPGSAEIKEFKELNKHQMDAYRRLKEIMGDKRYRPSVRSPRLKALEEAIKGGIRDYYVSPDKSVPAIMGSLPKGYRANLDKYRQLAATNRSGRVSAEQLEQILRDPDLTWTTRSYFGDQSTPFSILRPKNYDADKAHKRLRNVAADTISGSDMGRAATLRRFMPKWLVNSMESAREYLNPRGSRQAPTCAGGACYTATGSGKYDLPSDLRFNKNLDTVKDYVPRKFLKERYGSSAKRVIPLLQKDMRRAALKTSLPGLAVSALTAAPGVATLLRNRNALTKPKFNLEKFVSSQMSNAS